MKRWTKTYRPFDYQKDSTNIPLAFRTGPSTYVPCKYDCHDDTMVWVTLRRGASHKKAHGLLGDLYVVVKEMKSVEPKPAKIKKV